MRTGGSGPTNRKQEGTKCLGLYGYAKDKIIFLTGFYVCEAYINQVRRTSDIMHYAFYILHYHFLN
jgi:hypothetical protein